MKKKIFLDLDETLIYAAYAGTVDSKPKDEAPILHPRLNLFYTTIACELYGDGEALELYRGYLRNGAVEFIRSVQNEFGKESVYILTRAVADYAKKFSEAFNFAIDADKIYSREHIAHRMNSQKGFHAVLVDNLPGRQCEDKIAFLNRSEFSKVSTIQVKDFYGIVDTVLSDKLLETIRVAELPTTVFKS